MQSSTVNDGVSLTTTKNNGATSLYIIAKGATAYTVDLIDPIKINGSSRPSSGTTLITYSSTTGCSPMKVRFISSTQFGLSCPLDASPSEVTLNWSDADVQSALTAARN